MSRTMSSISVLCTYLSKFYDDPFVPEPRHELHCGHPHRYYPTRHYPSPHCQCYRMEPAE